MQRTKVKAEKPWNERERLTVDTETLMQMLGAGRQTATATGTAAGARVQVGRRVLWNVQKIQTYLDRISGE